jgi:hypothetical protein
MADLAAVAAVRTARPGTGGFGAGNGSLAGGGGGGLGAGGDIFVQQGGKLTVIGGTLTNGTEIGGTGANGAGNGSAYGGIFIQGTMTVTPTHTRADGDPGIADRHHADDRRHHRG